MADSAIFRVPARAAQAETETDGPAPLATLSGETPGERARLLLDALLAEAASPFDIRPSAVPYEPADFTGAGQIIVILDDGYSTLYDQSATVAEFDFFGADDPDASVTRVASHGSWVAQAAIRAAEDVSIVHYKVFSDTGGSAMIEDIEQALAAVLSLDAEPGTEVVAMNLSLGVGNAIEPETGELSDEFAALLAAGVMPIVAAGNSGTIYKEGVSRFAADPSAVAVSATDATGAFASFSQHDAELTDLAAPGTDIPYVVVTGVRGTTEGTSFAAPQVAGAVARVQQAAEALLGGPLAPEAVLALLQQTGTPVADEPPAPGYRIVDADAALALLIDDPLAWADSLFA